MVLRIKKRKLKEIYLVLFLFILIFAPPILPKSNLILAAFSLVMVLIKYKKIYPRILKPSSQLQWCLTVLILIVYALCIIWINSFFFNELVQLSHYFSLFNRFLILTITLVCCSTYYICYSVENKFFIKDFIRFITFAALIQAFFIIISFISDDIHTIFLNLARYFGDSSLYYNEWYITIRSFGLAGTLVDTFGFGMGLLAGIALLYGVFYEKKYIIFSVIIALTAAIDTRTTLLIYAISIVLILFYFIFFLKIKKIIKYVCEIIGVIIAVITLLPLIAQINMNTYNWLMKGITSIGKYLGGDKTTGTFAVLFSDDFWQIPDTFQLIFGSGHSLYGASGYAHSDVGYINDIWFIGILGMMGLYTSICIVLCKCYRLANSVMIKLCMIFFGISIFVFNIKGGAVGYNAGTATIFSTVFLCSYLLRSANNEDIS